MSTTEAVMLGVVIGLAITAARVAWVFWTTRLNTLGDYLLVVLCWHERRKQKRMGKP